MEEKETEASSLEHRTVREGCIMKCATLSLKYMLISFFTLLSDLKSNSTSSEIHHWKGSKDSGQVVAALCLLCSQKKLCSRKKLVGSQEKRKSWTSVLGLKPGGSPEVPFHAFGTFFLNLGNFHYSDANRLLATITLTLSVREFIIRSSPWTHEWPRTASIWAAWLQFPPLN